MPRSPTTTTTAWLDVYVTNIHDEYMKECAMLWHNNGDGTFTDLSRETGTCDTLVGLGREVRDFDNDAWLDLFVVNGLRSAGPDNYIPVLVEDDHERQASTSPTSATGRPSAT